MHKGVWIYIADVKRFNERVFLYVGKTGCKVDKLETSPWGRLTAHLDNSALKNNCLLHHLKKMRIPPEECVFELTCFGPCLVGEGVSEAQEHLIIEEAEAQLAERIDAAGYPIVGKHRHRLPCGAKAKPIVDRIVKTISKKYLTNVK